MKKENEISLKLKIKYEGMKVRLNDAEPMYTHIFIIYDKGTWCLHYMQWHSILCMYVCACVRACVCVRNNVLLVPN